MLFEAKTFALNLHALKAHLISPERRMKPHLGVPQLSFLLFWPRFLDANQFVRNKPREVEDEMRAFVLGNRDVTMRFG